MARPIRVARPWQPVEVTARTLQGRFLLAPSERLALLVAGILAIGRERYQVRIYNLVFLSNHFHMLVAAASPGELSRFMGFVMGNVAREAGRLHGWSGPFWERRHRVIPIMDEESLLARMRYVFSNGSKEGLVRHPSQWPGLNAVDALTTGRPIEGVWVNRTGLYCAGRRGGGVVDEAKFTTKHQLYVDPLPMWEAVSESTRRSLVSTLVEDVASDYAERSVPHRARPRRQHPHHRPRRVERRRAPACHAASRANREAFREMYRAFLAAYRRASEHLRDHLAGHGYPTHSQVLAYVVDA